MTQIPKNAAGFNQDFKAMKKDLDSQFAYLKRVPVASFVTFFKITELEAGIFSEVLRTLANKVDGAEDTKWAGDLMLALSKASKFDMTLMFAEDDDVSNISAIVEKVKAVDAGKGA